MRVVKKLDWYREHGYGPRLPAAEVVEACIRAIASDAEGGVCASWERKVYEPGVFDAPLRALEAEKPIIEAGTEKLRRLAETWSFYLPDAIEILVTRYGVGGSYRRQEGQVLLRISEDGGLKTPAVKAIHEIVHIGVEQSIVEAHALPHDEKEAVVDGIIVAHVFPDYAVQDRSNADLVKIVKRNVLGNLPEIVGEWKKSHLD